MKRLGKFTGQVYDENYDFSKCPECCVCISDEQAEDEQFIQNQHMKDLIDCLGCLGGCPASSRNI